MSQVQTNTTSQSANQMATPADTTRVDDKATQTATQSERLSSAPSASEVIANNPSKIERFVEQQSRLENLLKNPNSVLANLNTKIDKFIAQKSTLDNLTMRGDAVKPDAATPDAVTVDPASPNRTDLEVASADTKNSGATARGEASLTQVQHKGPAEQVQRNQAPSKIPGLPGIKDKDNINMINQHPKWKKALIEVNRRSNVARMGNLKDEHINAELKAEGITEPYRDNGGIDPTARKKFNNLMGAMKRELATDPDFEKHVKADEEHLKNKVKIFRGILAKTKNPEIQRKLMNEANEAAKNKGKRPVFDKDERLSELKDLIKYGAPSVSQALNYKKGGDLPIGAVSGHRSYKYQGETLFAGPNGSKIKRQGGIDQRRLNSALPGCSQHHTGRAIDALSTNDSWWKSHKTLANWLMNPNNQSKFHYEVPYHPKQSLRNVEPWHLYFPK